MTTPIREKLAKKILGTQNHSGALPHRSHRQVREIAPQPHDAMILRELGWNDRFYHAPSKPSKERAAISNKTQSKEKKIQEERVQYGGAQPLKKSQKVKPTIAPTSNPRLAPLAGKHATPRNAIKTKEEKLHFRVLKAIEERETLIYQLNALILCTPVQEQLHYARPQEADDKGKIKSKAAMAIVTNYQANGAMTNSREATKLAKQLAADLQLAGIQVVESIVEWMLEVGGNAEKPPVFIWRGRSYFHKMVDDLDFAEEELQIRGIKVDCLTKGNPLLVKPNQKLGRVLAAQSIISEMVQMTSDIVEETPKVPLQNASSKKVLRPTNVVVEKTTTKLSEPAMKIVRNEEAVRLSVSEEEPKNKVHIDETIQKPDSKQVAEEYEEEAYEDDTIEEDSAVEEEKNTQAENTGTGLSESVNEKVQTALESSIDTRNPPSSPLAVQLEEEAPKDMNEETEESSSSHNMEEEVIEDDIKKENVIPECNNSDQYREGIIEGDTKKEIYVPASRGEESDQYMEEMTDEEYNKEQEVIENKEKEDKEEATESRDDQSESDQYMEEMAEADYNNDQQVIESKATKTNEKVSEKEEEPDQYSKDIEDEEKELIQPKQILADSTKDPEKDKKDKGVGISVIESDVPVENSEEKDISVGKAHDTQNEQPKSKDDDDSKDSEYDDQFYDEDEEIEEAKPPADQPIAVEISASLDKEKSAWANDLQKQLSILPSRSTNKANVVVELSFLDWYKKEKVLEQLEAGVTITQSFEGSLLFLIECYELFPTSQSIGALLTSPLGKQMNLAACLVRETLVVLDSIFIFLVKKLQKKIDTSNQVTSGHVIAQFGGEIEFDELLEAAHSLIKNDLAEYGHKGLWKYGEKCVSILKFLRKEHVESLMCSEFVGAINEKSVSVSSEGSLLKFQSNGFNAFFNIFYPHFATVSREQLGNKVKELIREVFSLLAPMELQDMKFLLEPGCKALLLNAGSSLHDYDDDENEASAFPKLRIVCQRGKVIETSLETLVTKKNILDGLSKTSFHLYPFFRSAYGEKSVDGHRVEEGEGKGPLKEWFSLLSQELVSKWELVEMSLPSHVELRFNGNKLISQNLTIGNFVQPGYQLEWLEQNGNEQNKLTRVVNSCIDATTLLLDKSVSSVGLISIEGLCVYKPRRPYFEYLKSSESFWLNEHLDKSSKNHQALVFVGWIMANTIGHYTKLDLPLNPFLFKLLMERRGSNGFYSVPEEELETLDSARGGAPLEVTLDDIKCLDPSWYDSLMKLKQSNSKDFKTFLQMEGIEEDMTFENYIKHLLKERFGPESNIHWQIQALRQGFEKVYSIKDLHEATIQFQELHVIVCGSYSAEDQAKQQDFQIDKIFRVIVDSDFAKCKPLQRAFWLVVNGLSPEEKRKFVKFVTGVSTLPVAGTEFLRIEMPFSTMNSKENEKTLLMLPQSHTCDNILELPHYWKALCWKRKHDEKTEDKLLEQELGELIRKKLYEAVEYSSGYGLDATSGNNTQARGRLLDSLLPSHSRPQQKSNVEESTDLLDIPAMGDDDIPSLGDDIAEIPTMREAEHEKPIPILPQSKEKHVYPIQVTSKVDITESINDDIEDIEELDDTAPIASDKITSLQQAAAPIQRDTRTPAQEDSYDENDWETEEL